MSERERRRYALWLAPAQPQAARLEALIAELSERHRTPAFVPHVTLLGGIAGDELDLAHRVRQLADRLHRLWLEPIGLDCDDDYFRSLFLSLRLDPRLQAARTAAEAMFQVGAEQVYRPHLSLMYGGPSSRVKALVAQKLASLAFSSLDVDGLVLCETAGMPASWRAVSCCVLE